jgi:Mrp family chromosome partitioning ATPase
MTDAKNKPPLSKEEIDELREDLMLSESLSRINNTFMILSGKGGVGKSTVAVNIAAALAAAERDTGLLDIDIHGPSVPKLLGLERADYPGSSAKGLVPVRYGDHLKVMSMEFVTEERDGQPVIWRGPMKHRMIWQFLAEVDWGNLDFLIVDAPPGTGDEPLSICQMAPRNAQAIIVTTPQEVALKDVRKSIGFCRTLGMPIYGIIENMSGFVCPDCGAEHDLFKKGGGERLAREQGFRFLGRIPIDPGLVTSSDDGKPMVVDDPASPTSKAFEEMIAPMLEAVPLRMKKH